MEMLSTYPGSHNLPVMLLPLNTDAMLVPDIMVVEICGSDGMQMAVETPDWFVGYKHWRGYKVPIISFEALNGAMPVDPAQIDKLAIIKSTVEHGYLPYYALVISDTPVVYEISGESVILEEGRPRGRAEVLSVALEGRTAGIPNTEWIENHLLTYLLQN